jgi:hypothetical protein
VPRRLAALVATLVAFAVLAPSALAAPRLFAPDSVWNQPVPAGAALDPSSATRVNAIVGRLRAGIARGISPSIADTSYSTPLYTVGPDQPTVAVRLDVGKWGGVLQRALDEGVPLPADARPAAGKDAHLTVYQPSSDTLWEFWHLARRADGWHAGWGGVMRNVSTSPGYYTNTAVDGLGSSDGWNWGSTATSLPVIGGTVMTDELRAGEIDHALAAAVPWTCSALFAWPAQRTDGKTSGPGCLPEGAHLRLDPSLNLDRLDLPPVTRVLARAAQRYGLIIRDATASSFGFYFQDPTPTGADPYMGAGGLYQGDPRWKIMRAFPWDRLQLLQMTLCTTAPCVAGAAQVQRSARSKERRRHRRSVKRARR